VQWACVRGEESAPATKDGEENRWSGTEERKGKGQKREERATAQECLENKSGRGTKRERKNAIGEQGGAEQAGERPLAVKRRKKERGRRGTEVESMNILATKKDGAGKRSGGREADSASKQERRPLGQAV